MKQQLTIHMIVKNNESTIEDCISSFESINCNFLIADLGCGDKTIENIDKKKAKIIRLSCKDDMSELKNNMIQQTDSEWILFIEPWEKIIIGQENILKAACGKPEIYSFNIIQGDILSKEIRLWHRSKNLCYKNPVFETIEKTSIALDVYVSCKGSRPVEKRVISQWINKNPLSPDPFYYMACWELTNNNWDSFINYAELFLHQQKKKTMSTYMTEYYLSMIQCYVKKNYQNAMQHIFSCIIKNPTMAEFWCLLGDIHCAVKQYEKAIDFYDNAIILGSRRKINSEWPMEISKYKQYPEKMIESCKKIMLNTKVYERLDDVIKK